MIDPLIQFFERLVTQFSWGRLFLLLTTLCIAVTVLVWYESYTGQFRLGRVDRATALLAKLTELSPNIKSASDDGLTKVHKALVEDLVDYVSGHATPFSLSATTVKVMAAAFPWVLLGLGITLGSTTGANSSAILGMSVAAIPIIIIAAYMPDFERRWINLLAYPFGSMIILCAAVMIWQNRRKKNGA